MFKSAVPGAKTLACIKALPFHWLANEQPLESSKPTCRLVGDIVTQRGNRNQITYGVGVAYAFKTILQRFRNWTASPRIERRHLHRFRSG
jgi:hypothetical protein